jgi:hypothetical protein
MTIVRVKGVKQYRSKGRWYYYHRLTGTRLRADFGTGEFFAELAALERRVKREKALPGTLGSLLSSYRESAVYQGLAPATRHGYARMMNLLKPIDEMPLTELSPQAAELVRIAQPANVPFTAAHKAFADRGRFQQILPRHRLTEAARYGLALCKAFRSGL